MRRPLDILRSPVGLIVYCGLVVLIGFAVSESAGPDILVKALKTSSVIFLLQINTYANLVKDLLSVRDLEGLGRSEREKLRAVVSRNVRYAVGLTVVLVLGAGVIWFVGVSAHQDNLQLVTICLIPGIAVYSFLISVSWTTELADFKSSVYDRQQALAALDADLKVLTDAKSGQATSTFAPYTAAPDA